MPGGTEDVVRVERGEGVVRVEVSAPLLRRYLAVRGHVLVVQHDVTCLPEKIACGETRAIFSSDWASLSYFAGDDDLRGKAPSLACLACW